jgi:predicted RNase H-like HicB family nuclease
MAGRDSTLRATFTIELERAEDGRWIAEVPGLPGVLCYGRDREEAVAGVQALALRVIAERLENREPPAEFLDVTFQAVQATGPPPKRSGFLPPRSESAGCSSIKQARTRRLSLFGRPVALRAP